MRLLSDAIATLIFPSKLFSTFWSAENPPKDVPKTISLNSVNLPFDRDFLFY
ncbi:hypothetical protein [Brunnivagina elsteri]|uniref:hypothetical protein n=1 Tax=Brunnivagina elsteri TaxID=1247191 RepID=UPI001B80B38F|nr:hypothetical protein [Calothrix elsteri]